ILCQPCPTCSGRDSVRTPETVCYDIFREIMRETRQFNVQDLLVLASQDVIDVLLDEESTSLAELAEQIGVRIRLHVEALYTQEQCDVVTMCSEPNNRKTWSSPFSLHRDPSPEKGSRGSRQDAAPTTLPLPPS